jgi:hypothetical protein
MEETKRKQLTLNYKVVVNAMTDESAIAIVRKIMEDALTEHLVVKQHGQPYGVVIYKPKITHIKDVTATTDQSK